MKVSIIIIITVIFFSCNRTIERNEMINHSEKEDRIAYFYYYGDTTNTPTDSIKMYANNFEKSLEFYKDYDSISKTNYLNFYFNVFKINNEKFAVLIDSTTKIYKFQGNHFEKLFTENIAIVPLKIEVNKIDLNSDGFLDFFLKIPSGGSHGDDYLCFFYLEKSKSLVYENKVDLCNIEINLKEKTITSNFSMSSEVYLIDGFSLRLLEKRLYLSYSGEKKLQNKIEITKFNNNGKEVSKDTVNAQ
jgi:hypothetical protein